MKKIFFALLIAALFVSCSQSEADNAIHPYIPMEGGILFVDRPAFDAQWEQWREQGFQNYSFHIYWRGTDLNEADCGFVVVKNGVLHDFIPGVNWDEKEYLPYDYLRYFELFDGRYESLAADGYDFFSGIMDGKSSGERYNANWFGCYVDSVSTLFGFLDSIGPEDRYPPNKIKKKDFGYWGTSKKGESVWINTPPPSWETEGPFWLEWGIEIKVEQYNGLYHFPERFRVSHYPIRPDNYPTSIGGNGVRNFIEITSFTLLDSEE